MASVAALVRNINLYVDGASYAGKLAAFQPPDLNIIVHEYRAGGMDGSVALDKGLEPLKATFTLHAYDPDFLSNWGVAAGDVSEFHVKAALEGYEGDVSPVWFTMRGRVTSMRRKMFEGAIEKPEVTIELHCSYYKEVIGGFSRIEIDILNHVRIINGVDRLARVRAAMGLSNPANITGVIDLASNAVSRLRNAAGGARGAIETITEFF